MHARAHVRTVSACRSGAGPGGIIIEPTERTACARKCRRVAKGGARRPAAHHRDKFLVRHETVAVDVVLGDDRREALAIQPNVVVAEALLKVRRGEEARVALVEASEGLGKVAATLRQLVREELRDLVCAHWIGCGANKILSAALSYVIGAGDRPRRAPRPRQQDARPTIHT